MDREISNFSADEINLLRRTILEAGAAMVALEPGGMIRQALAVFKALAEADETFEGDVFIHTLVKVQPQEEKPDLTDEEIESLEADEEPQSYEQNKAEMLADCREAVTLLQDQGTPQQLAEYRQLVLSVVERAAKATRKGGFLGIGGKRLDEAEAELIAEIRQALGAD
jgi:hypothetical protein